MLSVRFVLTTSRGEEEVPGGVPRGQGAADQAEPILGVYQTENMRADRGRGLPEECGMGDRLGVSGDEVMFGSGEVNQGGLEGGEDAGYEGV